jgi:hypothetical protein
MDLLAVIHNSVIQSIDEHMNTDFVFLALTFRPIMTNSIYVFFIIIFMISPITLMLAHTINWHVPFLLVDFNFPNGTL